MNKIIILFVFFLSVTSLSSCDDERNEDITESVNKNGSIETAVKIEHVDSLTDVLITTHKVWVKQDLYKNIEYRDTLPALGIKNTVAENDRGDTRSVAVPQDYEIYITVK